MQHAERELRRSNEKADASIKYCLLFVGFVSYSYQQSHWLIQITNTLIIDDYCMVRKISFRALSGCLLYMHADCGRVGL